MAGCRGKHTGFISGLGRWLQRSADAAATDLPHGGDERSPVDAEHVAHRRLNIVHAGLNAWRSRPPCSAKNRRS